MTLASTQHLVIDGSAAAELGPNGVPGGTASGGDYVLPGDVIDDRDHDVSALRAAGLVLVSPGASARLASAVTGELFAVTAVERSALAEGLLRAVASRRAAVIGELELEGD